ncbi:MAG TPA: N-acetyltransferase family protein [Oscillospiraceae bacterium]|nr:N-acetyltransferase family protein [Oscillospiraceae bacterium]
MVIRNMRPSDWDDVARIYTEGIQTGSATFETVCPTWEKWNAAHLRPCRLVAEEAGEAAGWAALTPVSSRCVYEGVAEVSIYIAADRRGSGVGRALLGALIDASGKAGFWTLQSSIFEGNTASIRLHRACGFRTVGLRERIARDRDGVWRNIVLMERRA